MQLRVDLKKTRLAAYRPGTYQNLQSQWRAYLLFCLYFDFTPVPASENVLCLYVQFLSRTLTVGAICNYLNGVRLFHLFHGIDYPHHSSFPLKLTLLGLAKSSTHTSMQALPITVSVLRRVFHVLHPDTALEWVVYCTALFAFFLIARLSNILPVSTARFDLSRDLCRRNVQFIDSYIAVIFDWSKTIQCRERRLVIPLVPISGSPLCPVSAFHKMLQLIPARGTSPAFCYHHNSRLIPLTKAAFILKFRELLVHAHVPSAVRYTGHSFRRGGATYAFRLGVPGELIQVMSDWKSDAYKRYFDFSFDTMLSVSCHMRDSIVS